MLPEPVLGLAPNAAPDPRLARAPPGLPVLGPEPYCDDPVDGAVRGGGVTPGVSARGALPGTETTTPVCTIGVNGSRSGELWPDPAPPAYPVAEPAEPERPEPQLWFVVMTRTSGAELVAAR